MSSGISSQEQVSPESTYSQTILSDARQALSYSLFQKLQTTLDVSELLSLFQETLSQFVAFDSMHYKNSNIGVSWDYQSLQKHQASYTLTLKEKSLGELKVSRSQAFAAQELNDIETALSFLMHPLNNSIQYSYALQNSLSDPLTDIGNRKALEKALHREIESAKRHQTPLAILMLDLDKFKVLNDELGHLEGDKALKLTANILKYCARECDMAFRYGGDEFILLMSKTGPQGAMLLAERLKEKLKHSLKDFQAKLSENMPKLSASIGITHLNKVDDQKNFIQRADNALRQAKQSGRNNIVYQDS